jgi:hypothetical protein
MKGLSQVSWHTIQRLIDMSVHCVVTSDNPAINHSINLLNVRMRNNLNNLLQQTLGTGSLDCPVQGIPQVMIALLWAWCGGPFDVGMTFLKNMLVISPQIKFFALENCETDGFNGCFDLRSEWCL